MAGSIRTSAGNITSNDAENNNAATVSVPTGIAQHDCIVLVVVTNDNTKTITAWPSGFTEISTSASEATLNSGMRVAVKDASGSESGTFTCTASGFSKFWTRCFTITGAGPSLATSAATGGYAGFVSTIPTTGASVTTGATNQYVVHIGAITASSTGHTVSSYNAPSGFTAQYTSLAAASITTVAFCVSDFVEPNNTTTSYSGSIVINSGDTCSRLTATLVLTPTGGGGGSSIVDGITARGRGFGPRAPFRYVQRWRSTVTPAIIYQLQGSASLTFGQTGSVTGSGALAGTSALTFGQTGAMTGAGALAGSAALTFGQTATLTGAGSLSASATLTFGQTGALTGAGALVGSSALTFGQTGTLLGSGLLSGTASLTFGQNGALLGDGALSGTTTLTFAGSATGTVPGQMVGTCSLTFDQSATLTGAGALSGSASLSFNLTGTLNAPSAPVIQEQFTGGFFVAFEREQARRARERRKRLEDEEAAQEAARDAIEREIAKLLHEKERERAQEEELARLSEIVDRYAEKLEVERSSERIERALTRVIAQKTVGALMALDRELVRAQEEEEFAVLMALALDD